VTRVIVRLAEISRHRGCGGAFRLRRYRTTSTKIDLGSRLRTLVDRPGSGRAHVVYRERVEGQAHLTSVADQLLLSGKRLLPRMLAVLDEQTANA
jgi:hypothetical protein